MGGRVPFLTGAQPFFFLDCLQNANLTDLRSSGHILYWSNQSGGARRIIGRLDRALVNPEWIQKLHASCAEYLTPGCSDHAPILVLFRLSALDQSHESTFACGNPTPIDVVKKAPGHEKSNVSSKKNKLKNTKLALKAWDKQSFGKTGDRVRICGNKVNEILFKQDLIQMDPLNAELVDEEKES